MFHVLGNDWFIFFYLFVLKKITMVIFEKNLSFYVKGIEENNIILSEEMSNEISKKINKYLSTNTEEEICFINMTKDDFNLLFKKLGNAFESEMKKKKKITFEKTMILPSFPFSNQLILTIKNIYSEKDLIMCLKKTAKSIFCLTIDSEIWNFPLFFIRFKNLEKCFLSGKGTLSFFLHVIAMNSENLVELEIRDLSQPALLLFDMKFLSVCYFPKIRKLKLEGIGIAKMFTQILQNPSKNLELIEIKDGCNSGLYFKEFETQNIIITPCVYFTKTMMTLRGKMFFCKENIVNPYPRKIKKCVLVGNGAAKFFHLFSKECPLIEELKIWDPQGFEKNIFKGSFLKLKKCFLYGYDANPNVFKKGISTMCVVERSNETTIETMTISLFKEYMSDIIFV